MPVIIACHHGSGQATVQPASQATAFSGCQAWNNRWAQASSRHPASHRAATVSPACLQSRHAAEPEVATSPEIVDNTRIESPLIHHHHHWSIHLTPQPLEKVMFESWRQGRQMWKVMEKRTKAKKGSAERGWQMRRWDMDGRQAQGKKETLRHRL